MSCMVHDIFLIKFCLLPFQNETIFLAIDFETDDDQHLKKLDLDKPLISGITGSFHDWIKERNYDTQRGARSSWI